MLTIANNLKFEVFNLQAFQTLKLEIVPSILFNSIFYNYSVNITTIANNRNKIGNFTDTGGVEKSSLKTSMSGFETNFNCISSIQKIISIITTIFNTVKRSDVWNVCKFENLRWIYGTIFDRCYLAALLYCELVLVELPCLFRDISGIRRGQLLWYVVLSTQW